MFPVMTHAVYCSGNDSPFGISLSIIMENKCYKKNCVSNFLDVSSSMHNIEKRGEI